MPVLYVKKHFTLKMHERVHSKLNPYICKKCAKPFEKRSELLTHNKNEHKTWKCKKCHLLLSSRSLFQTHRLVHRQKCTICDQTFETETKLKSHEEKHDLVLRCDVCDKEFKTSSALKDHRIIHTGEKPYKCSLCPKSFNNAGSHSHHKTRHQGNKFQCNTCRAPLSIELALLSHIKRNHEGKPAKVEEKVDCSVCSKTFTKATLKVHMVVHTGEQPYKCKVCSTSFNNHGSVSHHEKIHFPENMSCEVCQKVFYQQTPFEKSHEIT